MKKQSVFLVVLMLTLASCAPVELLPVTEPLQTGTPVAPTEQPTLSPVEATATLSPPPSETPLPDLPGAVLPAAQAAQSYLAQRLNLEVADIQVLQVTAVEWRNSCLGINIVGMMCADVITPGYVIDLLVIVDGKNEYYVIHSDAGGNALSLLPGAVYTARQALIEQTGSHLEDILWVSVETVEWRDSCLGVTKPGVNCLDVIVPGYRIVFQLAGERYEYHTNQDGSRVVAATLSESSSSSPVLEWISVTEPCMAVEIDLSEVRSAPCGMELLHTGDLPASRAAELEAFTGLYARQVSETAAGLVTLRGTGRVIATPAEMRMLAEWARLVYDEAASGRSGAAWSLAFSWHLEGGIAGFCDDLGVYLTGEAIITSCKSGEAGTLSLLRLDSQQLESLFAWMDSLAPFEMEQTDPATADAMTIHLVFNGQGMAQAGPADQQAILELASELVLQAQTLPDLQAQAAARQSLIDYFAALAAGDYAGAAALYGGSYGLLIDNNPSRDPADHAALFESACRINGFVCTLSIRSWVYETGLGMGKYRFIVELQSPEGALIELGQCCTDASDGTPLRTQFAFLVELVDGRYLVMTLPIYAG